MYLSKVVRVVPHTRAHAHRGASAAVLLLLLLLLLLMLLLLLLLHCYYCYYYCCCCCCDYCARGWLGTVGLHKDSALFDRYLNSLYWSIQVMTTVGFGDGACMNFACVRRVYVCVCVCVRGGWVG